MGELTEQAVEPLLRGSFGRPYRFEPECVSTQDLLRDPGLPEGAVAVSDHQTAGRGRSGREWDDVAGAALLCSVLLRPPAAPEIAQLSLVCGLAVAEAIEHCTGLATGVKWPNDALLGDRKVAGVLLEAVEGAVICGIGVNVNQAADRLPEHARLPPTSIHAVTGLRHDRTALLVELLAVLEARYAVWQARGLAALLPALEPRNWLKGRALLAGEERGLAGAIAADGRLEVALESGGTTLVGSGEVVLAP